MGHLARVLVTHLCLTFLVDRAYSKDEVKLKCDNSSLTFTVQSNDVGYQFSSHNYFSNQDVIIAYGNPLSLMCQSDAPTTIKKDGVGLLAEETLEGVRLFQRKPAVQYSEYVCMDTTCEQGVKVLVAPALEIQCDLCYLTMESGREYIMQYGQSLEVLCSGPTANRLALARDGVELTTEIVSGNTVRWSASRPDLQISDYVCIDADTAINNSVHIRVEPQIYIRLGNETIEASFFDRRARMLEYRSFTYGTSIEVFCAGPRPVKLVSPEDNKELATENVNGTTVKLDMRNLELGVLIFGCIVSEIPNYISRVRLVVGPRIELVSPSINRYIPRQEFYVMKQGDPLEIWCSGYDAKQLEIFVTNIPYQSKPEIVNETTVKWVIEKMDLHRHTCSCGVIASEDLHSEVKIGVFPVPKAEDFQCVSYAMDYFNCTWTSESVNSYGLTYIIENGHEHGMCSAIETSKKSAFCVWYISQYTTDINDVKKLELQMTSCNELGCFKQTFFVEPINILKPAPIKGLAVVSTSSRMAVLRWELTYIECGGERLWSDSDFYHKVEFTHSKDYQPLEANSSLVSCDFRYCKFELKVPCPDQFYHVRIYQRLKKSVGDVFWSEASVVSFHTSADDQEVDPSCNEPLETAEVVTYFVQRLKKEVRLKMQNIRKKVDGLKKKRAKILAHLKQKRKTE